jgi:hypothetical protein
MTTLHDRLADLADEAPIGVPAPDLWTRGQRVHRRRCAGTVVIVAVTVLVLGILGVTSWQRDRQEPLPTVPTEGMRLPDHLYVPSRWLPGTDDDGPLGRLSAIVLGVRGVTGVSASTGEYRHLDLPGWIGLSDTVGAFSAVNALSADGTRVAYWYDLDVDQGVAVYDATTGEIERHDLPSEHGIEPDGLVFAGDQLWFNYQRYTDAEQDLTGRGPQVWDLGSGAVLPPRWPDLGLFQTTVADGRLVRADGGLELWTADRRQPVRRTVDRSLTGPVVVGPDAGTVAAIQDPDGPSVFTDQPGDLLVLRPATPRHLTGTAVPGVRAYAVLGWRDDQHLVVYGDGAVYRSVGIDSGEAVSLVDADLPNGNYLVAQDAWSAPSFDAPAPPDPLDPRLTWGGGVGVVVAGAFLLVLWRRRVRA